MASVNLIERLADRRRAVRERGRYAAFIGHVEPGLVARPRVHRFAAAPVLGDPADGGEPVAVCIDTSGPGDPTATRASLQRQTVAPAGVIAAPLAEAMGQTRAPWLLVLDAGDRLAPEGLERLGQAARLAPDAAVLTFDDDALDPSNSRVRPRLRPGPSPDLLATRDLTGGALCLRPGCVAPGTALGAGAARHRLALALAGDHGAGQAHVPLILRHRAARGESPGDESPEAPRGDRPVAGARGAEPAVEVIVCFRDRADLLRRCARSVLDVTAYDRLRLRLVDNASSDSATATAVRELAADPRVTVSRDDRPFNFSALNNAAAAGSDAEVLVFLNNDTEVIDPGWVAVLLEEALRPEVGAVGPLLVHADGSVQHAGAAIGVHGFAGHPFGGLAPGEQTPFGSALDGTRNWLAVTAACLMVQRRKLLAVGGFDERFVVAGNDVDLGLRLTAGGHRSLFTPHTRLVHDGSASRDPTRQPAGDQQHSRERYGDFLTVGDPFYHPALTLSRTDCSLRGPEETSGP